MADGMSPMQTDLCLVFDRGILSELYCDIKGRWESDEAQGWARTKNIKNPQHGLEVKPRDTHTKKAVKRLSLIMKRLSLITVTNTCL